MLHHVRPATASVTKVDCGVVAVVAVERSVGEVECAVVPCSEGGCGHCVGAVICVCVAVSA